MSLSQLCYVHWRPPPPPPPPCDVVCLICGHAFRSDDPGNPRHRCPWCQGKPWLAWLKRQWFHRQEP
jgi:hypothetical protein